MLPFWSCQFHIMFGVSSMVDGRMDEQTRRWTGGHVVGSDFFFSPGFFPSHTSRVVGMTADLLSPHHPVRLLARSQPSTFQVSLTRVYPSCFRSSFLPFPSASILNIFFTVVSSSLLIICLYQFNHLSVIFLQACATLVVPGMCSFLILSLHVTPHIHHNIHISVTSESVFFILFDTCKAYCGCHNTTVWHQWLLCWIQTTPP